MEDREVVRRLFKLISEKSVDGILEELEKYPGQMIREAYLEVYGASVVSLSLVVSLVSLGDLRIIKFLVESKRINLKADYRDPALRDDEKNDLLCLWEVIKSRNIFAVEYLLEKCGFLGKELKFFNLSYDENFFTFFKQIIALGADVNKSSVHGEPIFQVLKSLMKDRSGKNPLSGRGFFIRLEMLEILIRSGARCVDYSLNMFFRFYLDANNILPVCYLIERNINLELVDTVLLQKLLEKTSAEHPKLMYSFCSAEDKAVLSTMALMQRQPGTLFNRLPRDLVFQVIGGKILLERSVSRLQEEIASRAAVPAVRPGQ